MPAAPLEAASAASGTGCDGALSGTGESSPESPICKPLSAGKPVPGTPTQSNVHTTTERAAARTASAPTLAEKAASGKWRRCCAATSVSEAWTLATATKQSISRFGGMTAGALDSSSAAAMSSMAVITGSKSLRRVSTACPASRFTTVRATSAAIARPERSMPVSKLVRHSAAAATRRAETIVTPRRAVLPQMKRRVFRSTGAGTGGTSSFADGILNEPSMYFRVASRCLTVGNTRCSL
mmetsp:Transcript_3354/g.13837  ORF Transcript_3354/g.13837 Transcript_3354/m.13837 type:complete len:239 (+) Transcript_3354:1220-1936(+)